MAGFAIWMRDLLMCLLSSSVVWIPVDLFLPGIMGSPVEYIYSTGLPKTRHFAPVHCVDDLNCAFSEA